VVHKQEMKNSEKRLCVAGTTLTRLTFFRLNPVSLLILILMLPGLACQAISNTFQPAQTQALHTSQNQITRAVSPTPLPATPTWTLTPSLTATPSPTPTPSETPTPVVTPSAEQLRVFEELWQTVRDNYLYPDFNGLDWDAIHSEFRQRIQVGLTNEAFYIAMDEMVSRLGDNHSVFLSPEMARQEDSEFAGQNNYVGIGVFTRTVPERKRVVILLTFPGGPAEDAGLQPHDSILAADGQPILDENGFRRDLLLGPQGSKVELTVQSPGQEPRQVELTRRRVNGSIPVPFSELTTPEGKRVGYILLPTFSDETVINKVKTALITLSAQGTLDGVIMDNRMNNGGADYVARGVLAYFTRGVVGYFIDRDQHKRSFNVIGTDVKGSSKVPVVVLVDSDTVSFGEIFSGVLRDMGRAYIIGQTTAGNVELLRGYDFEDGSRAWIAHEAFHPRNHLDQIWEKTGVVPDQVVESNWDEVTLETDPVVKAALDHFDGK
jgi:carboxyl-terminal processing protease